jgi:hypothetical protein
MEAVEETVLLRVEQSGPPVGCEDEMPVPLKHSRCEPLIAM